MLPLCLLLRLITRLITYPLLIVISKGSASRILGFSLFWRHVGQLLLTDLHTSTLGVNYSRPSVTEVLPSL